MGRGGLTRRRKDAFDHTEKNGRSNDRAPQPDDRVTGGAFNLRFKRLFHEVDLCVQRRNRSIDLGIQRRNRSIDFHIQRFHILAHKVNILPHKVNILAHQRNVIPGGEILGDAFGKGGRKGCGLLLRKTGGTQALRGFERVEGDGHGGLRKTGLAARIGCFLRRFQPIRLHLVAALSGFAAPAKKEGMAAVCNPSPEGRFGKSPGRAHSMRGMTRMARSIGATIPPNRGTRQAHRFDFRFPPRLVAASLLIPLLALAPAASAQITPLDESAAPPPTDLRGTLGECPADLLRQAWGVSPALSAAAVESEALAICTERSEAIEGAVMAQVRLDRAVARLLARAPTGPVAGPGPESQVDILHAEVGALKARIARLEAAPEQPDTAATLDGLRDDLARTEGELARAQSTGQAIPAPGEPQMSSNTAAVDVPTDHQARAREDEPEWNGAAQAAPADPAQEPDPDVITMTVLPSVAQNTGPEPAAATPATPAPGAPDTPGQPAAARIAAPAAAQPAPDSGSAARGGLPPDRPTAWQVIHAVRQGEGPWRVRLRGTREIALSVPGATPEDPPVLRWQSITDPPVTRTVGDTLPGGLVLRAVTDEGVTLGDPIAPGAPVLLSFTSEGDSAPGDLEWQVINLSQTTEGSP